MTDWRDRLIVKSTPPARDGKGNRYLRQLYRALEEGGWRSRPRGPDFFAFKKSRTITIGFMAVQAVRKSTYRLRRHQRAVLEMLARCGVPCFRYNCDVGEFEEINFKPPAGVTPPGWREQMRREEKGR
jgi:hypothetical protein